MGCGNGRDEGVEVWRCGDVGMGGMRVWRCGDGDVSMGDMQLALW